MFIFLLVALLLLDASAALGLHEASTYPRQENSTLSVCIDKCVQSVTLASKCPTGNLETCFCSEQFQQAVFVCLGANCTAADVSEVAQALLVGCPSVTSEFATRSQAPSPSSTGAVADQQGSGNPSNVAAIAGIVGGTCGVLLIVIAGYLVYRCRRSKKGRQWDTPMTQDVAAYPIMSTLPRGGFNASRGTFSSSSSSDMEGGRFPYPSGPSFDSGTSFARNNAFDPPSVARALKSAPSALATVRRPDSVLPTPSTRPPTYISYRRGADSPPLPPLPDLLPTDTGKPMPNVVSTPGGDQASVPRTDEGASSYEAESTQEGAPEWI